MRTSTVKAAEVARLVQPDGTMRGRTADGKTIVVRPPSDGKSVAQRLWEKHEAKMQAEREAQRKARKSRRGR